MGKYLLFNVGCIECGVSSNVVGIFDDKDLAESLARSLSETHGWREGGQNEFEVFELPEANVVSDEYLATEGDDNG